MSLSPIKCAFCECACCDALVRCEACNSAAVCRRCLNFTMLQYIADGKPDTLEPRCANPDCNCSFLQYFLTESNLFPYALFENNFALGDCSMCEYGVMLPVLHNNVLRARCDACYCCDELFLRNVAQCDCNGAISGIRNPPEQLLLHPSVYRNGNRLRQHDVQVSDVVRAICVCMEIPVEAAGNTGDAENAKYEPHASTAACPMCGNAVAVEPPYMTFECCERQFCTHCCACTAPYETFDEEHFDNGGGACSLHRWHSRVLAPLGMLKCGYLKCYSADVVCDVDTHKPYKELEQCAIFAHRLAMLIASTDVKIMQLALIQAEQALESKCSRSALYLQHVHALLNNVKVMTETRLC